ncbi:GTPase activating protein (GAP) [Aspergillus niger]
MPTVIALGSSVCRSQKPSPDDAALALYDDPDPSCESFVGFCASFSPNPDCRLSSNSSRFRPNRPSAGYSP